MRRQAHVGLAAWVLLGPACARENPLFGLGAAGGTAGGDRGSGPVDSDTTLGGDAGQDEEGTAVGTTQSSADGTSTPVNETTAGVDDDGTTFDPPPRTTDDDGTSSSDTRGDDVQPAQAVVLFEGPLVFGDFLLGHMAATSYNAATQACEEVAKGVMPCAPGAPVFAVLRAEPISVFVVDALPMSVGDLPVVGPTGIEIAENVTALLDGTLTSTLADAMVVQTEFWTGGYVDEPGGNDDCEGWASDLAVGYVGREDVVNAIWFDAGDRDCADAYPILCACVD